MATLALVRRALPIAALAAGCALAAGLPASASAATCAPETSITARAGTARLVDTGCPGGAITDLASASGAAVTEAPGPSPSDPRLIRYATAPAPMFPPEDLITFKLDGEPQTIDLQVAEAADAQPRCRSAALTVTSAESASGPVRCYDPDGDPIVVEGTTPATLGTTSAGSPTLASGFTEIPVTYGLNPSAGPAAASDAFAVKVHEELGGAQPSRQADVTVTIPADTPPACPVVNRSTPHATAFAFQLACSDADPGDALTYAITAPSLHSMMIFDNAGAGSYSPVAGFSGADVFTFAASDGRTASPPAAFNISVARPPAPRKVITATIRAGFQVFSTHTTIARLAVTGLPSIATLQLRCSGSGCPFQVRTLKTVRAKATAAALLAQRRLRPGAVVEVRLTAPGYVGKASRYAIRARRVPLRRDYCLTPGSSVLRRRC